MEEVIGKTALSVFLEQLAHPRIVSFNTRLQKPERFDDTFSLLLSMCRCRYIHLRMQRLKIAEASLMFTLSFGTKFENMQLQFHKI